MDCEVLDLFKKELKENSEYNRYEIGARLDEQGVFYLEGMTDTWQQVVDIGHIAGQLPGLKGVVNDIKSRDYLPLKKDRTDEINAARAKGIIETTDVLIVGGGIIGCAVARQLSKNKLKIILVDKCSDICEGTTKANNGMIHPGHEPKNGSLKAYCNVRGNALYTQWAEELNFKLTRPGQFVVARDPSELGRLKKLYENALTNQVPGVELMTPEQARDLEPALKAEISGALYMPTAGFVEPYEVALALAENAILNGVKLMLSTEVLAIEKENETVETAITTGGLIKTRCVINCAGLFSDELAEMVDDRYYTIHPRRGTLLIFDKPAGNNSTKANLSTLSGAYTKGGGNMRTPEGNPLWGPSAKEVPQKTNLEVDQSDYDEVISKVLTQGVNEKDIITFFSGLRAATYSEDFIIEPSSKVNGFINVAGIQSPGLASAPAIAEMIETAVIRLFPNTVRKPDFNPIRKAAPVFRSSSYEEKEALIVENRHYGRVICRCEQVTEAEVVNAIHGTVPAVTVDAVKRRTRAGMGRCQGGFCGPLILSILSRELGISLLDVTKNGKGSEILSKDLCDHGGM